MSVYSLGMHHNGLSLFPELEFARLLQRLLDDSRFDKGITYSSYTTVYEAISPEDDSRSFMFNVCVVSQYRPFNYTVISTLLCALIST